MACADDDVHVGSVDNDDDADGGDDVDNDDEDQCIAMVTTFGLC